MRFFLPLFILLILIGCSNKDKGTSTNNISSSKPNELLQELNKLKIKTTKMDLTSIGIACESYLTYHGYAPKANNSRDLKKLLSPHYVTEMPETDSWRSEFRYEFSGEKYAITSAGPDQTFETFDDLIFSQGNFLHAPKQTAREKLDNQFKKRMEEQQKKYEESMKAIKSQIKEKDKKEKK